MYRDNEKNNINWLKIFLKVLIFFLLLFLCIKLVSIIINNQEHKKTENILQENLKVLDKVARGYFTKDNIPTKAGDTVKVYVSHLIDTKAIDELKDDKGASCNYDKSFIQITRLDSEYQIKSYLDCNGNNDYLNTFVDIDQADIIIKPTKTTKKVKTTTKKKTTKKIKKTTTTKRITTTKKVLGTYHQVSFNTNGGNILSTQTIKDNSTIKEVIPTRDGYKFIGWYYEGRKFNTNTRITKDYVLVAKWIKE
ncbi:MAG: InlB B-repeat-containing protein [Bacilli bacterium]|nr:InlB B-repeat-containing protein [Bacilli bacterium]